MLLSTIDHTGKVIVTGIAHPLLAAGLRAMDYTVVDAPAIVRSELDASIEDAVGLIVTTRIAVDASLLQKAKKLKWVGRLGSGMELIDTAAAAAKGVWCFSSPEGNRLAVAEHALGMLLSLMNPFGL